MAKRSDLKSCLIWYTEPPFESPRCSSYFRLDGEEWFLELRIIKRSAMPKKDSEYDYDGFVLLLKRQAEIDTKKHFQFPREDKKITKKCITVSCCVVADKVVLDKIEQYSSLESGMTLLRFHISSDLLRNPSVTSLKWKIYCQFCSDKPFSIRMNNETILLSTGPLPTGPIVQSGVEIPPDLQRLSDDFSCLLDKEIIPDAKVVCCGRTWNVHKCILTARSEVFAAMFRSGMAESETSEVHIQNLEDTVLDILLKYIYSGSVPDVPYENMSVRGAAAVDWSQLVRKVYEAADRYALHGLRDACSHWLADRLSCDNCLKFLVMADAHCDAQLKEAAVTCVAELYTLIEKDDWTDFRERHPRLAIKVLERFAPS